MKKSYLTSSAHETFELAISLSKTLTGGEVVLVDGEIGAGKTVFCKGLACGLGVVEAVTSPTYSINNIYDGEKLEFHHFDFYRITNIEEAITLGLHESFGKANAVCAIEWSENILPLLPTAGLIQVKIGKESENIRSIKIATGV